MFLRSRPVISIEKDNNYYGKLEIHFRKKKQKANIRGGNLWEDQLNWWAACWHCRTKYPWIDNTSKVNSDEKNSKTIPCNVCVPPNSRTARRTVVYPYSDLPGLGFLERWDQGWSDHQDGRLWTEMNTVEENGCVTSLRQKKLACSLWSIGASLH